MGPVESSREVALSLVCDLMFGMELVDLGPTRFSDHSPLRSVDFHPSAPLFLVSLAQAIGDAVFGAPLQRLEG